MSELVALRERVIQWHRLGQFAEADAGYRRLIAATPVDAALRHDHAVLLMQHGRADAAAAHLEALVRQPTPFGRSEFLLAMLYRDGGRVGEALGLLDRFLLRAPDDAWALALAGALRTRAGDAKAGEVALRRALALYPDLPEAQHDLGITLHRQRRWDEACDAYRQALRATPDDCLLRHNFARCLESRGDLDQAADAYAALVARWPRRIDLWLSLAGLHAQRCDFDAEARSVAAIEALVVDAGAGAEAPEAFPLTFLPLSLTARRALLAQCAAASSGPVPTIHSEASPGGEGRRLRLGYLSADFGQHAVGVLVQDLFAAHDRERVEVHGYSLRHHDDTVAATIRSGCDVYREFDGVATRDIAAGIARDGIDVLIDLGGYTEGARPQVLALRPAPLQFGYLGFIHDYGAEWIDGVLMDDCVDAGPHVGATDRRLHLCGLMLPAPRRIAPHATATRADFGLPEGLLFASFNNSYKLDRELIDAWIEISRRVPAASFVVYVPEVARARLAAAWVDRGGVAHALHLVAKLPAAAHRQRATLCDLFLDAFRYQGGATGIAAIDAGLPILSREGATPLARLGVSLNRFLGLDELVCIDTSSYIDRACELAQAPQRLQELRTQISAAVESRRLFDPRRVAAAIEDVALAESKRHRTASS
jgi:protein O-GlcNAc transferase